MQTSTRFIVLRERPDSDFIVVDKHTGRADTVAATDVGDLGRVPEPGGRQRFQGVDLAVALADGVDFSAEWFFRA